MISRKLLFIALFGALSSGGILSAMEDGDEGELCATQQSCQAMGEECQCYCSRKCGPRDWMEGDTGYWKNGKCWCKKWDYKNYRKRCE